MCAQMTSEALQRRQDEWEDSSDEEADKPTKGITTHHAIPRAPYRTFDTSSRRQSIPDPFHVNLSSSPFPCVFVYMCLSGRTRVDKSGGGMDEPSRRAFEEKRRLHYNM